MQALKINSNKFILLFSILLIILRLIFLYFTDLNLYADEAQYYFWSLSPDFGYYSKPPLIAWIIWLSTNIFGSNEFGVRFFAPVIHFLTAWIIYLTHKEIDKNAIYSFFIYLTLPAICVSSVVISTDVLLLLFWALGTYILLKNFEQPTISLTILLGITIGFALLSKYNAGLFYIGYFIFILTLEKKDLLKNFKHLVISGIVSLITFAPNLWWNYNNHFASFKHTKDISKLDRAFIYPNKFFEFFLGQSLIIGPILFICFLLLFLNKDFIRNVKNNPKYRLLFIISITFLLFISLLSLISGANINWAAPSFIGFIILISIIFNKTNKKLLNSGVLFNVFIITVWFGINLLPISTQSPLYRIKGWNNFGKEVHELYNKYEKPFVLIDERKLLSWCLYYCNIPHQQILKLSAKSEIKDHYDLTKKAYGEYNNAIIISKNCDMKESNVQLLKEITPLANHIKSPKICAYHAKLFKTHN
ncbi:MAG: glycosyltransferase family 39 protein [Sphingobacteriia bacterium]|nr:glycosyltransferase family 39 protein [Sphingobacteriia bacterium]